MSAWNLATNGMAALLDHPLLLRLSIASVELVAIATLAWGALVLLRPRSPRLRALIWLIVLAKPVLSLATGNPWSVVRLPVAASREELAPAKGVIPRTETATSPLVAATGRESTPQAVPPADRAVSSDATPRPESSPIAVSPLAHSTEVASASHRLDPWTLVAAIWTLGVAFMLVRSGVGRRRAARLVRRSKSSEAPLAGLAERLARNTGLARAPRVLRSGEVDSPALVGTLRPVILVPSWMKHPRDLHWSLQHELTHLALRDPLAACVRELAQVVLYFHPLVWWAGRRWEEAAELACDRAIVADADEALDYADRLCAIARRVVPARAPALANGFFVARSRVGHRLEALLRAPLAAPRGLGRVGAVAVALLAVAAASLGGRVQSQATPADRNGTRVDDDSFCVRGRVLDPDGKPMAEAPVEVMHWYWDRSVHILRPKVTSLRADRDGRFSATCRKSDFDNDTARDAWRSVKALCVIDGFGPGWDDTWNREIGAELTLRLVHDAPVKGRVVDLEGRPVANAAVRVESLQANAHEDLGPFLASVRAHDPAWHSNSPECANRYLSLPPGHELTATTDAEGRFELHGLGAHRVAHLQVRGEAIALLCTMLVTEPLERPLEGDPLYLAAQIHGSSPLLVAQPTQPIEGIVRAADTGEPLPDVEIASWQFAGSKLGGLKYLSTTTDEAGRFRLVGMPKGKGNQIYVRPNDEQPYFDREIEVPEKAGLETIEMTVTLDVGIWISGRVIEAKSGKPGRGVVHYLPFFSNPFMQKLPQLALGGMSMQGDQHRFHVADDGTFRVLGLPGPALIGVTSAGHYRQGVGFEQIAHEKRGPYGLTYDHPVQPSRLWPTSMARIDPPADAESATCDLVLEAGETIRVRCVDETSHPLADFEVYGAETMGSWRPKAGATIDVECVGAEEQRPVAVRHAARKLGLYTTLSLANGNEQTITLLPLVSVVGRVLDESGDPIRKASITVDRSPSLDFDGSGSRFSADEAGRFRIETVLCGSDWRLGVERSGADGFMIPAVLADVHDPKPGQVIELGDIVCKPVQ